MKIKGLLIIAILISFQLFPQGKFLTKEGYISFFSHTVVEDIKAENSQVLSIIDTENGEVAIQLLMKSFMFKKALMQEHFNDSYAESFKYPKATFRGFILNFKELENQESEVEIKGILSVHGKDKEINIKAKLEVLKDQIILSGYFIVDVADFDIKIPRIVRSNIAKTIKVSFKLKHKPYN